MKCCLLIVVLAFLAAQVSAASKDEALAESAKPIRPGFPIERPFWNRYARQFIYAPAFDIDAWPGGNVEDYVFTAHSEASGKDYVFKAKQPFEPLTPIWQDLPAGPVKLTVTALNGGGKELGQVGSREFHRMPVFAGPYAKPGKTYAESAKEALKFQFDLPRYQGWKDSKRLEHRFNCYPNKMMSAVVYGMVRYSRIAGTPAEAKDALAMAKGAARCMIGISFPKGSPMEYWPPTYDPESQSAKTTMTWIAGPRGYNVMTVFPADAGLCYLDLYDATGEKEFLDAAKRVADTYRKLQLDSGTWPLLISVKTGEAQGENLTIPNVPILFLDRLEQQYGVTDYKETLGKAVGWMFKNPMETYLWQGQFEDIKPSYGYVNLSHKPALSFAIYLLNHPKEHPEYKAWAEELLRFSEDQFCVWEPCGPKENRMTPCALEQYRCYGPIISTMARFINTWTLAYRVTGSKGYLERAQSLGNTIIEFQKKNKGQYRTWHFLNGNKKENNWDNAATEAALAMLALSEALGER